jgi:hypothetical protein
MNIASLGTVASEILESLVIALEDAGGPAGMVEITSREDDPEQPSPFGVWFAVDGDMGHPDTDLLGAGDSPSEALADALRSIERSDRT